MEDKDKLFLVVYFGVKDRPMDIRTNQMMIGFHENLRKTLDDTVKVYVIPQITTNEVKMELLNVEKVSDEKIDEITKLYEKVLDAFKQENKK